MLVTRLGIKAIVFYAMLVCAFFAAPYLNLFFMLLSFCTVLAVLSIWWAHRNAKGVRGSLAEIPPMPAGASQIAHATLRCERRTRHDLELEIAVEDGWFDSAPADRRRRPARKIADHIELRAGEGQSIDVLIPPMSRGVHPIVAVRVTSLFPFGMVETRRAITAPDAMTVYPAPADLAEYRDRNEIAGSGLGGADAAEMGPAGLREFREGDELRNVHWKASARRRDLVVKEFEGDAAPGMEVLLDLRASGAEFEAALSLIAGLALECKENKELFTLHTQEHTGTYGKGHTSFDRLLSYLAEVNPLTADCAAPPAVSPTVLRLPLRHPGRHPADGVQQGSEPRKATC